MSLLFSTVYGTVKVLFLIVALLWILAFLSVTQGYLPEWSMLVYDRLEIVTVMMGVWFLIFSFFRYVYGVVTRVFWIHLILLLLLMMATGGVFYLYMNPFYA